MKRLAVLIVTLILMLGEAQAGAPSGGEGLLQRQAELRASLRQLAAYSPDPCGPPYGGPWRGASDIELRLFDQAQDIVTLGLNSGFTTDAVHQTRQILDQLEKMSAKINAAWPQPSRLHFQVLDLPPAVVVQMSVRERGSFFVFGAPEVADGQPGRTFSAVGSDDVNDDAPQRPLALFPLHRGPSGHPRFLAEFEPMGCAGSFGIAYYAYEWDPRQPYVDLIIEQAGSLGLDDKVPGFPHIGTLRTEGEQVTLPYCWFSSIDTWDNPSLCAVDTYDLSGDLVRFRSRVYNRPDLVPVARAVKYAQQRDLQALLGYCASAGLAQSMIRDMPPDIFAEELRVTPTGAGKERVEMGDGPAYQFDVEKRDRGWQVVGFTSE